jgi:hypothetical protein
MCGEFKKMKQILVTEQIQKPLTEMSLSEMWYRASKELKQLRYDLGSTEKRQACALGALHFYSGDGEIGVDFLSNKICKAYCDFDNIMRVVHGMGVVELNNVKEWSFERFADEARELGF